MELLSESAMEAVGSVVGIKLPLWLHLLCNHEAVTFTKQLQLPTQRRGCCRSRFRRSPQVNLTSHVCLHQKIFADFTAEGVPVIETSTLTEEGVMHVKTEVRQTRMVRRVGAGVAVLTALLCVPGLRPPPGHSCGDEDEGQEGP